MSDAQIPRLGTIEAACRAIGGDKPINKATYYRGAKAGRFPPPRRVGPNISRVDMDELAAMLRAAVSQEAS